MDTKIDEQNMPAESATPGDADAAAAPEQLTPAQIAEIKSQAAKAAEHWDRLVRTSADFENFKKRAAREKQDAIRYSNEGLILKLIPVLDNFEIATAAAANSSGDGLKSLQDGVNMIQSQLRAVLVENGLEEINATGKQFDPNFHEAVTQQESADVPEGQVLQQLRKGYKLRDRLLRPATVIVAKAPAAK